MSRATFAFLLGAALCVGCSNSDPSASSAPQPLPTHDNQLTVELLTVGTLEGTVECLWLSSELGSRALIFQQGWTARKDGEDVVLLDEDGNEIARTGDTVGVTGGVREEATSCSEEYPNGAIVAGPIERTDEGR